MSVYVVCVCMFVYYYVYVHVWLNTHVEARVDARFLSWSLSTLYIDSESLPLNPDIINLSSLASQLTEILSLSPKLWDHRFQACLALASWSLIQVLMLTWQVLYLPTPLPRPNVTLIFSPNHKIWMMHEPFFPSPTSPSSFLLAFYTPTF